MGYFIDKVASFFRNTATDSYYKDLNDWNNCILNYCSNDPIVNKIFEIIEMQLHIEDVIKQERYRYFTFISGNINLNNVNHDTSKNDYGSISTSFIIYYQDKHQQNPEIKNKQLYSELSIDIPLDTIFSQSQCSNIQENNFFIPQRYPHEEESESDNITKSDWYELSELLNQKIKVRENKGELLEKLRQQPGLYNIIYAPFFLHVYIGLMHSIISGEYAMKDDFSKVLIDIRNTILNYTKPSATITNDIIYSALNFFEDLISEGLSKVLKEFQNFNSFIEAQIDQAPSLILDEEEHDQYNIQGFEDAMIEYSANYSNLKALNKVLPFFFHELFEMTKIDQNYYFSKKRLYHLITLKEMIGYRNISQVCHENGRNGKRISRYGLLLPLIEMTSPNSEKVEEVFNLIAFKNDILIYKILQSCPDNTTDLTYIGLDAKYVFDPRRCADKQPEKDFVRLKKPDDFIPRKKDGGKINNKLLDIFKKYRLEDDISKEDLLIPLREYEKEFFNARSKNDYLGFEKYYHSAIEPHTEATNKDIRHYNTKILEMARDSVRDTAELRTWVKLHKNDFNEIQGLYHVKKVINYCQSFHSSKVCFDAEFLLCHIKWCIGFLEAIEKKSITDNPDHVNRSKQIEETLLLLDTLLSQLKKLIQSIESNTYCVPYASKFRGCFWQIEKDESELTRIFNDNDDNIAFVDFVQGKSTNEKINRERLIFIASTYVPPVNYEQLFADYRTLKFRASALRSEIHAEYFNRIREYIKEDAEKQLDANKKTVIQILGIFAALLALTTIALNGINSAHTPRFFLLVMLAFALCLGLFVLLLYSLSQRNPQIQIKKTIREKIHNLENTILHIDSELDLFEKTILNNLCLENEKNSEGKNIPTQDLKKIKKDIRRDVKELKKKLRKLHCIQQEISIKNLSNKIKHPILWVVIGMTLIAVLAYYVYNNSDIPDQQQMTSPNTQINLSNDNVVVK